MSVLCVRERESGTKTTTTLILGSEHPAGDTTAFRAGFGPEQDVPIIGFFANGELGPGAAGQMGPFAPRTRTS